MSLAKIIGLTGNIGSGKSTVSMLFELNHWPVFNADNASKLILKENNSVIEKINDLFGEDILDQAKKIDNKKLAQIVFSHNDKLNLLNSILHPEVKKLFHRWHEAQKVNYVVRESALLFETGIAIESFKNITVSCPFEIRLQRALKRDDTNEQQIIDRENKQLSEIEKIKRSDFTIENYKEPLIPQVLSIIEQISKI